ncbi:hypothetical protein DFJ77DRAFT_447011, partial [Powellomyces hirtus]
MPLEHPSSPQDRHDHLLGEPTNLLALYGVTAMFDTFARPYTTMPGSHIPATYQPYIADLAGAPHPHPSPALRTHLFSAPPPTDPPPSRITRHPRETLRAAFALNPGRVSNFDYAILGSLYTPRHSNQLLRAASSSAALGAATGTGIGTGKPPPVPQKRISLKLNLGAALPTSAPADDKKKTKKRRSDDMDASGERRPKKKKRSFSSQGSGGPKSPIEASSDIDIL